MLTTLAWILAVVASLIHLGSTRVAVRLLGRGADNAWDNALGYLAVSVLSFWPTKWAIGSRSLLLVAALPLVLSLLHLFALQVIYEVKKGRALAIGCAQAALSGALTTLAAFGIGVAAAYIVYGRIVSDPLVLLRLVLRLIGIDPWF